MELSVKPEIEPPTLSPIRVETALSRYPVHRLAKHGDIAIDIVERRINGEMSVRWEVTYNSKYGQPGPLAYKLDTLLINRRIEEAKRPVPKTLRLGSFREINTELVLTNHDTEKVKRALRQNAFAAITAKITYRQSDGSTRTLEADFTRYSVVFTGEELPDGRKADAVYIILNDVYMQVINGAMTRPLDYDYLKILPPASQRFYELLSFQMYATLKHGRSRAKLRYSELCTYSPLTRQYDWNVVRPQLARIHAPHKKSGYVGEINFQETVDADGKADWIMLYQPGPKARAEFRAFTKRGGPVMLEVEPFNSEPPPPLAPLDGALLPSPLECELIDHGVTVGVAKQLAASFPEEAIRLQLEILDWLTEKKPEKITEPAAYLVTAIKNSHATPKGFVSYAERERRAEAKRAKEQQAVEEQRRKQEEKARDQAVREAIAAYREQLTPEQLAACEAAALAQAEEEARRNYDDPVMRRFQKSILHRITDQHIRSLLVVEGVLPPE